MPHIHVIGGVTDRDAPAPLVVVGEVGPEPARVEDPADVKAASAPHAGRRRRRADA